MLRHGSDRVFVVERQMIVQRAPRNRAIHRSCIQMLVIETPRNFAGDGAFTSTGRTINGNNQATRGHAREYIRAVLGSRCWVLGFWFWVLVLSSSNEELGTKNRHPST